MISVLSELRSREVLRELLEATRSTGFSSSMSSDGSHIAYSGPFAISPSWPGGRERSLCWLSLKNVPTDTGWSFTATMYSLLQKKL